MNRGLKWLFLFVFFGSVLEANASWDTFELVPYEHYHGYPLKVIKSHTSEFKITEDELQKWDQLLYEKLLKADNEAGRMVRVYTYLYAAQRDFAALSYDLHGELIGSIDTLCLQMIRLFFPSFAQPDEMRADTYSIILAELIVNKYEARMEGEEQQTPDVESFFNEEVKNKTLLYGRNILSWLPWVIPPLIAHTAPSPDLSSTYWNNQIDQVARIYKSVTKSQKNIAKYWGTAFAPRRGNWILISNTFLFEQGLSLNKIIYLRSLVSMAMYDALIVAFQVKYTYMLPPPYIAKQSITPYVEYYDYPSYPSEQAVVSWSAATLLGYYFPKEKALWDKLAAQASLSRLWAGMNYPVDISVGEQLGIEVAHYFELIPRIEHLPTKNND